jgi:hypothetical protein
MLTNDSENKFEFVTKALELADRHYDEFHDLSAEYMTELLTDYDYSTYKMFESLASSYVEGSAEVRNGIDTACSVLTGWNFTTIAERLVNKFNGTDTSNLHDENDWADFLADKLGLNSDDKRMLIHDICNLRGKEWIPTLNDAGVDPVIVKGFTKYLEEVCA